MANFSSVLQSIEMEMSTYCPLVGKPPPLDRPGPKSDLPSTMNRKRRKHDKPKVDFSTYNRQGK